MTKNPKKAFWPFFGPTRFALADLKLIKNRRFLAGPGFFAKNTFLAKNGGRPIFFAKKNRAALNTV
jgi:hypothetical protein